MKKKITILIILTCLFYINGHAQTPFWSDTFEDVGAPSSGTRNAPSAFTTNTDRLFNRTNTAGVTIVGGPSGGAVYTGMEGTKFWAGEDTDNGQPINVANVLKTVTWTINIAGRSNIKLRGLFAAGNNFNNAYENGTASSTGVFDYMSMQYSIDGGPIQNVLSFYPLANAASDLYPDNNFDGNGDPATTALSSTFTEFTGNITGTGTTLTLYMNMSMTSSAEEVAIDNLRLLEIAPCTPPVVTVHPQATRNICSSANTTFSITATGATGYQWQVNTGSGFTDITNGAPYSGATTNTLTITGATTGMNGYLYRCVAYNPTISCFTNSNSGTLNVSLPVTSVASQTNVSCNGGSNGAASVTTATGGVGPYTYNWTPGNPTGDGSTSVTGLTAGTWTCTVTDSFGCTAVQNFTITEPSAISFSINSQTDVSCFNGSNGAASVTTATGGTGTKTYNWTPGNPTGDGTTSVTGLTAGTWTCTVTDANGCTSAQVFNIAQPTALSVTASGQTNVSCNGGSNGAASVNLPTGGTAGYTYNWTPGNPTGDGTGSVTGLTAGTWTCTVTDVNSCTTSQIFNISEPAAINTNVNQSLGIVTAEQTGATYQWYQCPNTLLSGETNQSFTPSTVGDYKVDITVAGCTVTSNCITVTVLDNDSFELVSKFKLYPNPNNGILNIDSKLDGNIMITNQLGQVVKRFDVKANTINTINVQDLSDGTYFVKGSNGTTIQTQKLVIQH